MQKWEYRSFTLKTQNVKEQVGVTHINGKKVGRKAVPLDGFLDQVGDEGWELVGIDSSQYGSVYLFKRPK